MARNSVSRTINSPTSQSQRPRGTKRQTKTTNTLDVVAESDLNEPIVSTMIIEETSSGVPVLNTLMPSSQGTLNPEDNIEPPSPSVTNKMEGKQGVVDKGDDHVELHGIARCQWEQEQIDKAIDSAEESLAQIDFDDLIVNKKKSRIERINGIVQGIEAFQKDHEALQVQHEAFKREHQKMKNQLSKVVAREATQLLQQTSDTMNQINVLQGKMMSKDARLKQTVKQVEQLQKELSDLKKQKYKSQAENSCGKPIETIGNSTDSREESQGREEQHREFAQIAFENLHRSLSELQQEFEIYRGQVVKQDTESRHREFSQLVSQDIYRSLRELQREFVAYKEQAAKQEAARSAEIGSSVSLRRSERLKGSYASLVNLDTQWNRVEQAIAKSPALQESVINMLTRARSSSMERFKHGLDEEVTKFKIMYENALNEVDQLKQQLKIVKSTTLPIILTGNEAEAVLEASLRKWRDYGIELTARYAALHKMTPRRFNEQQKAWINMSSASSLRFLYTGPGGDPPSLPNVLETSEPSVFELLACEGYIHESNDLTTSRRAGIKRKIEDATYIDTTFAGIEMQRKDVEAVGRIREIKKSKVNHKAVQRREKSVKITAPDDRSKVSKSIKRAKTPYVWL